MGNRTRILAVAVFAAFNALPWLVAAPAVPLPPPGTDTATVALTFDNTLVTTTQILAQNVGPKVNTCAWATYDPAGTVDSAMTFVLDKDSNFLIPVNLDFTGSGVVECTSDVIVAMNYMTGNGGGGTFVSYDQSVNTSRFQWGFNDVNEDASIVFTNRDPQSRAFSAGLLHNNGGQVLNTIDADVPARGTEVQAIRRVPRAGGTLEGFSSGGSNWPVLLLERGSDLIVQMPAPTIQPNVVLTHSSPLGPAPIGDDEHQTFTYVTNAGTSPTNVTIEYVSSDGDVADRKIVEDLGSWNTEVVTQTIRSNLANGILRVGAPDLIISKNIGEYGEAPRRPGSNAAIGGFNGVLPAFSLPVAARKRLIGVGAAVTDGARVAAGILNLGSRTAKVKVIVKDGTGKKVFARTVRAPAGGSARLPFARKARGADLWVDFRVRGGGQSVVAYLEHRAASGDVTIIPAFPIR